MKTVKYESIPKDKFKPIFKTVFEGYRNFKKSHILELYKTEKGYAAGFHFYPLFKEMVMVEFTKEEFEELIDEIYMVTKDEEEQVLKPVMEFDEAVDIILSKVGKTLKEKNESYGNAALKPIRVFSKADALEQIKVRLDDKLSRISRGKEYGQEDTYLDILGYLVLHEIHKNYAVK